MLRRRDRSFLHLAVSAFLLACLVPGLAPAAPLISTLDPNAPLTAIVETANAAATQTMLAAPTATATETPTRTVTPTETATPTFLFIVATRTVPPTPITPGRSGLDYHCQIISQSPANDTIIARDTEFNAVWLVTNVGKSAWLNTDADYRYNSGARLHRQSIFDFEIGVAPGASIELTVPMKTPSQPDIYSTEWRIVIGRQSFCPLRLKIIVN
ncbi:MAG TPA: NBR1-Ig-like domain-containing protein [Anaerolineales bacterium]|nr:NBR1-Ig-like domain-containing protein [Anaerolineales bacterium]